MENLEYVCCHCENAQGGRRILESFRFKTVEEAVEFTKKQKEGTFSWWEVQVEFNGSAT